METDVSEGTARNKYKNKARGRKNQYFKQIDQEDRNSKMRKNQKVVASDDDGEGDEDNSRARLVGKRNLDAIREEDEILKDAAERRKAYASTVKTPKNKPKVIKPEGPEQPSAE